MNTRHERFVSLYGFFAFDHPQNWKNEVDEAGNYVFFDDHAGSGVLRILMLEEASAASGKEAGFLNELFRQHADYDPSDMVIGTHRFIHYVQVHHINNADFHIYYWVTAHAGKALLFTYTVQSSMKELPVAELEKQQVIAMMASLEFMDETAHHG